MNNLNSNLGNKSNLNLSNNSNNSNSNSTDYFSGLSNMSLIILIAFGFIVIVFVIIVSGIYLKSYNQSKIRDHIEEELLPYIHDCKNNPKIIYGTKIPASTLGNEFSLSFWVYINGLDYRTEYDKNILFKGKQGSEKQVNPRIYIKQRTNTMVFALETVGSLSSDSKIGCYDKLDILTYNTDSTKGNTFDIKIDMKDKIKDYTLNESGIEDTAFLNILNTYNALITDIFGRPKLISKGIGITRQSDKLYEFTTDLLGTGKTFENQDTLQRLKSSKKKYKIERVGDKYKILEESGDETLCATIQINANNINSSGATSVVGNTELDFSPPGESSESQKLLGLKKKTTFKFIDNKSLKIDNNKLKTHLTTEKSVVTDSGVYNDDGTYYAVFPLEFTIEETTPPELDTLKTGYYTSTEPRSVNGCKSDLQKLMDNPDNSDKYKDNKYNFYGMTGSYSGSGDTASQNMCYSSYEAIPDNIFSKIKTDKDTSPNKKGSDYNKLEDKDCVYDNKNYGLGSPNTMFIHSMEKDTGLEEVEIKNMPLQRWVNVTLQVHNNIIDIFMDGLLHKTHIIEQGAVKPNDDNIIIGSTGGFDGYVSRIIWANKALHPGEIYEKYKEGPRISLSITDRLKNLVGMGPKEPETTNADQTNNNKY